MSNTLADIWTDRRVKIGYESAEDLAKCFSPDNWRAHPEAQADALDDSLETLGWIGSVKKSIVTGRIFDGHLRVTRALLKDPALQIPVDYYDLTPDEEALALQVHDAITEQAQPIPEKLAALMERTKAMVADRPGLAGMLAELKAKVGVNGNAQPSETPPLVDKAEQLQEKWKVKPADIWQIGQHFVICGDCREPETWQRLLSAAGIEKVNGVFTSPPYAEQRKAQYGGVPTAEYVEWWDAVQSNVRERLAGDGSFFVNIKPHCEDGQRVLYVFDLVLAMVKKYGWFFVDELCWRNTKNGVPGTWPNRLKNAFEPVYHFCLSTDIKFKPEQAGQVTDGAFDYHPLNQASTTNTPFTSAYKHLGYHQGVSLPSNVIEVPAEGAGLHQAPFPSGLPTFFIKAYSDPGDSWLDPFCGSGTTIVAAHNEGRIGLGIERLEKYCAVILERLQAHTKQDPRLIT